jgi:hypothetical protein
VLSICSRQRVAARKWFSLDSYDREAVVKIVRHVRVRDPAQRNSTALPAKEQLGLRVYALTARRADASRAFVSCAGQRTDCVAEHFICLVQRKWRSETLTCLAVATCYDDDRRRWNRLYMLQGGVCFCQQTLLLHLLRDVSRNGLAGVDKPFPGHAKWCKDLYSGTCEAREQ